MSEYDVYRNFMKSRITDFDWKLEADISKGVPQPDFQKPIADTAKTLDLPEITLETAPKGDFFEYTCNRMSRRIYTEEPLSLYELSFLLWCTQGVKKVIGGYWKYLPDGSGRNYLRPVAAGGCINGFETYLAIMNVTGIEPGIWRYLPLTHQLAPIKRVENLPDRINETFTNPAQNQNYATKAGVVFFWACIPYRGEWLNNGASHKGMLLDLGHISHQLYLATEVLGCGCCAIGGYYQETADHLIGVDGNDEFTVLCASVGHVTDEEKTFIDIMPDRRDEH
ncbi:MAG: SagB/ThcOx family dehydrogenase [Dehalococcoidales bacterium]|nr:SagB/ThcOx family dehydrogenase [Dehalococcoidales bacterium]